MFVVCTCNMYIFFSLLNMHIESQAQLFVILLALVSAVIVKGFDRNALFLSQMNWISEKMRISENYL